MSLRDTINHEKAVWFPSRSTTLPPLASSLPLTPPLSPKGRGSCIFLGVLCVLGGENLFGAEDAEVAEIIKVRYLKQKRS